MPASAGRAGAINAAAAAGAPETGMDPVIDSFDGRYHWLANSWPHPVTIGSDTYASAEEAFAAAKTLDRREQDRRALPSGQAQQAAQNVVRRPNWDWATDRRYRAMGTILVAKFADPALADALAGTGDMLIIEKNRRHDDHWGDCVCPTHREFVGGNHLGAATNTGTSAAPTPDTGATTPDERGSDPARSEDPLRARRIGPLRAAGVARHVV